MAPFIAIPIACVRNLARSSGDPDKILFIEFGLDREADRYSMLLPYLQENYDLNIAFMGLGVKTNMSVKRQLSLWKKFCVEFEAAAHVFAYEHVVLLKLACGLCRVKLSCVDNASRADALADDTFIKESRNDLESRVPESIGIKILLVCLREGEISRLRLHARAFEEFCGLCFQCGWVPILASRSDSPRRSCQDTVSEHILQAPDLPLTKLLAGSDACATSMPNLGSAAALLVWLKEREEAHLADCLAVLGGSADRWTLGRETDRFCKREIRGLRNKQLPDAMAQLDSLQGREGFSSASEAQRSALPDVSIVIPAYNSEGTLPRALESVARQTWPLSRIQAIVVDDGSTDGTWEAFRAYKAKYPDLFVGRQRYASSGSPAVPRNEGLALARGKYVFFLDSDDWLGPEAVERMLRHALAWKSDMLLVKMVGENGRHAPISMFDRNQMRVDVLHSKVMWTFAPTKLFKRELLDDLEFPADMMPEDIPFVLRAYLRAKTVSVAADYSYYHATMENPEDHASISTWNVVESNLRAYEDIMGVVRAEVPSRSRDAVLMRRLFKRDVCNTITTINAEPAEQAAMHKAALREIFAGCYTPSACKGIDEEGLQLLRSVFEVDEAVPI